MTLHHEISGNPEGPWITLGHSLATDMHMWQPQLAALEEQFRVLRYDARGHGGSHLPEGNAGMDDLVDDVIALWDSLGIERSHVVGLSMGGMTGAGLALRFADRVLSLVACDCRLDAPQFFLDMWDQRIATLEAGGMPALVDGIIDTWLCPASREQMPEIEAQARDMILHTPVAGYIACARAIKTLDYKRFLGELEPPCLFIVGEHDGPHPAEMAELAALTPGARLVTLDSAAHLSNLEQPAAFNAAVLDFLAQCEEAA